MMADIAWSVPAPSSPSRPLAGSRYTRASRPGRRAATAPSSFPTSIWARAAARPKLLADFLAHNDCQTLFLVGDIVDGWQLKRRWFWTEAQSRVVAEILRKVDDGTRVIFVPGNHDEFAARLLPAALFAGIEIMHETMHETADGKRLLVLHGDRFDGVIACAKWLAHAGRLGLWRGAALERNAVHRRAKLLGLPYWSLSAWLKHKVKNAVEYISPLRGCGGGARPRKRGVDGVVCGHIHHAEIRMIGDVLYLNDGDWVESCSALVEDARGHLEILRWAIAPLQRPPIPAPLGRSHALYPALVPA